MRRRASEHDSRAQIGIAGLAPLAMSAGSGRVDRHQRTGGQAVLGQGLDQPAGELVAGNERLADLLQAADAAFLEVVQVAAADAYGLDVDQHAAGTRLGFGQVAQAHVARAVDERGLHRLRLRGA